MDCRSHVEDPGTNGGIIYLLGQDPHSGQYSYRLSWIQQSMQLAASLNLLTSTCAWDSRPLKVQNHAMSLKRDECPILEPGTPLERLFLRLRPVTDA